MTAGRGIVHSEMPKVTTGDLWGFQLWCAAAKSPSQYAGPQGCCGFMLQTLGGWYTEDV